MFCPRCATENANNASFCRACGADLRLVPQALTGHLPATVSGAQTDVLAKRKEPSPARLDRIFERIFVGLAFLAIVLGGLFFFRGGFMIWIWFIIPAFASIGSGIGSYLRYREERRQGSLSEAQAPERLRAAETNAAPPALLARDTSEMFSLSSSVPPPSVTENTTRHLDAERRAISTTGAGNKVTE
jgi:hypothetical protein